MATNRRTRQRAASGPSSTASTAPRPDRVRCGSCGMPVRGSAEACWSCGRDPQTAGDPSLAPQSILDGDDGAFSHGRPSRWAVRSVQVLGLLAVIAIALGAVVLFLPDDGDSSVRRLAEKVRGDTWERVENGTFAVNLPGPATTTPTALDGVSEVTSTAASKDGVVAVVVQGRISSAADPAATMASVLDRYAADSKAVPRRPVTDEGAAALDCTLVRPDGTHRLRVLPVGSLVFVFDVAAPDAAGAEIAFGRVVDGFEVTAR